MGGRLRATVGCVWHLVFLLAGAYLVSAILIPSIGGVLRFGVRNGVSSPWEDGAFWLTAAVAVTSLLFFLLAFINGMSMLCRVGRREPFSRRDLLFAVVGVLGCLLPSQMIPDSTLAQYPMMQPKWPPLPAGVVRHFCLESGHCFTVFFVLFGLSLAGCLFAYFGYDRRVPSSARERVRAEGGK